MLNLYLLTILATWIYSYGFTDLNLTLSSNPMLFNFVSWTQQLAYFHRNISTQTYLLLIIILWLAYYLVLNNVPKIIPWKKIGLVAIIAALAYPFLSHDVFKYLFSAKMVILYKTNPHIVSPDAFMDDTWIRFMRWINTPSPYGPTLTLIAIPAYLVGLGKFIPSLYIFKLLSLGWYALSIYVIGLISSKLKFSAKHIRINQLFFALHPTILIEGLSNSHNDLPMMALFLVAFYLLIIKKYARSALALIFSMFVKYITIALLPFYLLRKQINNHTTLLIIATAFILTPLLHYGQYQPWYMIWLITVSAISKNITLRRIALVYPIGGFLRYIPFISTGLWEATSTTFALLTFTPIILYLGYLGMKKLS